MHCSYGAEAAFDGVVKEDVANNPYALTNAGDLQWMTVSRAIPKCRCGSLLACRHGLHEGMARGLAASIHTFGAWEGQGAAR